jgi:hypothetical protein
LSLDIIDGPHDAINLYNIIKVVKKIIFFFKIC